jgi:hypothetical protein
VIENYPPDGNIPINLDDPSTPTITCGIGKESVHNALCDLGEGVTVMPLSLNNDYLSTAITLQMSDKSMKQHVGMVEDVILRIYNHGISMHFIILDVLEDDKLTIILGRSFLFLR